MKVTLRKISRTNSFLFASNQWQLQRNFKNVGFAIELAQGFGVLKSEIVSYSCQVRVARHHHYRRLRCTILIGRPTEACAMPLKPIPFSVSKISSHPFWSLCQLGIYKDP